MTAPQTIGWWVIAIARVAAAQPPSGDVRAPERIELVIGATATLPLAITVDRGITVSKDAPVIIDLAPSPGVTVKKRRLGRADAVDPEADAPRFAIQLRGEAVGEGVLQVRLRMWVCGGKSCRPMDLRRNVAVVVSPSKPPAPGP